MSSLSILMIYVVSLNLDCKPTYFGLDCKERCSSHCKNNEPCNHVSGECPGECQDGYMDEYCNSCKKPIFLLKDYILHIELLIFTKCTFFVDYSLQSRMVWEKLFFSMFSKLQWHM